jgi:hypothetical protein
MSYVINDRIAYMSQLIHAVIEGRAPLQRRLDCLYDGEGPTRTCTIVGQFIGGEIREYTTPKFKDIRVKNSPLWEDDPDQQLFYTASRSWARKWCPDVLLGVYTKEELQAQPTLGREDDITPGLHARLAGSEKSAEGHQDGHAARELAGIVGGGQTIDHEPTPAPEEKKLPKADKDETAAAKPDKPPSTPAQYIKYAKDWIRQADTIIGMKDRWVAERSLRGSIGMTADDRKPLDDLLIKRRNELEKLAKK